MTETKLKQEQIDFAIVTALKIEREAVLKRLDEYRQIQEDHEPLTYYHGSLTIPSTKQKYSVVVVELLGMGNLEAAAATTRLILRWQPASVLMVGIAFGIPGKVNIGDVVVADSVHYYELSKLAKKSVQARPQQFITNTLLYGRAKAYEATEWKGEIGVVRPGASEAESQVPEARFGTIASGEKLIARSAFRDGLLKNNAKIIAGAMEGAGVAKAVVNHSPSPQFLEIRGICDYGDEEKNDLWQIFAANAAAAFTMGLLRSKPITPLGARPVKGKANPLLILRAQSLRQIGPEELPESFSTDLKTRDLETVPLDFTDLVRSDALTDPAEAVRRLADPQGALYGALARRDEVELVFHGIVHIPLATLAGFLASDRQPVRLFDYQPSETPPSWAWPEAGQNFPSLNLKGLPKRKVSHAGEAIIRMGVSYPVGQTQTAQLISNPIIDVDLSVPQPIRSVVRSEEQTRAYGREFRRVIDAIANLSPECGRVHLFYAGPVSLAFHLGQQISANIHPPVTVWNYRQNRYEWGVDLTAASLGKESVVWPS